MQSIHSIETYVYGLNKDLVSEKEEIKCKNIRKNIKEHNVNWQKIPDHP